ncbi:hypothetical protein ILUMI_21036 [Ignelater luminosus]|uniref:Uncharacterized protein n=1 Tax=Ignelater luminosus TaxID=2038154 RepID=A0A8K0G421_IGNLU|nr:hypothetical protein ILUMI_21036 [Ignelater luminosus]
MCSVGRFNNAHVDSTKKKTQYEDMKCTEERGGTHKGDWAAGYSAMSKLDQKLDEESIFGRKSKLSTSPTRERAFTYAESEDEETDKETERKALARRKKWFMDNLSRELLINKRRRVSPPRPRPSSVTKIDVIKIKEPDTSSQKEDKTAVTNIYTADKQRWIEKSSSKKISKQRPTKRIANRGSLIETKEIGTQTIGKEDKKKKETNFTRTSIGVGNPIKYEKIRDIVLIMDEKEAAVDELIRQLELSELSRKKLEYGKIIHVETKSSIKTMEEVTLDMEESNWYILGAKASKED